MRILYYDIDTLRPDHLGCYGYSRQTSPNIDRVASQGVRFNNCYVSDAPCLPSRVAMFTQRLGIHTGIVGHGGTAADMKIQGETRGFNVTNDRKGLVMALGDAGYYTVSISPFAQRHAAWWFYEGFREIYNPGKGGQERADEVIPLALDWLDRKGAEDNWFLHVNVWDPHTPYRTPEEQGNLFKEEPAPQWLTDEIIDQHYKSYGPHSAHEPHGIFEAINKENPSFRTPNEIKSRKEFKEWIDGYDMGIWYADYYFGKILSKLEELGILHDTMIIITSDHGENQGELNIYGDHQTADAITNKVPMIVHMPGESRERVDNGLYYQCDIGATILELAGGVTRKKWDSISFANSFKECKEAGREYLVVSQNAWSCQRAVIFDEYILIKTYHDGYKDFPEYMLFDLKNDPHETHNLADERLDLVQKGIALLNKWYDKMMSTSDDGIDPMQIVLREGGPFHTRKLFNVYPDYLDKTDRPHHAESIRKKHRRD